jgi:excisionase family DNA binding protein
MKLAMVLLSRPYMSAPCGRIGYSWQSKSNIGKDHEMVDPKDEILTLEEVAAYLKAGKRTVYRLALQGDILAFKLGVTWRFRRDELDGWIATSIEKNPKQGEG